MKMNKFLQILTILVNFPHKVLAEGPMLWIGEMSNGTRFETFNYLNETYTQVYYHDVKIEYIKDANYFTLYCEHDFPIRWIFDIKAILPEEESLEILNGAKEITPENRKVKKFYSRLKLLSLSQKNTGWYGCSEVNGTLKSMLYILFYPDKDKQQKTKSYMVYRNKRKYENIFYSGDQEYVTIPCRLAYYKGKLLLHTQNSPILEYDFDSNSTNFSLKEGFKIIINKTEIIEIYEDKREKTFLCVEVYPNNTLKSKEFVFHPFIPSPMKQKYIEETYMQEGESLNISCISHYLSTRINYIHFDQEIITNELFVSNPKKHHEGLYVCATDTSTNISNSLYFWHINVVQNTDSISVKIEKMESLSIKCQGFSNHGKDSFDSKVFFKAYFCHCYLDEICDFIHKSILERKRDWDTFFEMCKEIKNAREDAHEFEYSNLYYESLTLKREETSGFYICILTREGSQYNFDYGISYFYDLQFPKDTFDVTLCVNTTADKKLFVTGNCESILHSNEISEIDVSIYTHKSKYMDRISCNAFHDSNFTEIEFSYIGEIHFEEHTRYQYSFYSIKPLKGTLRCTGEHIYDLETENVEISIHFDYSMIPEFLNKIENDVSLVIYESEFVELDCLYNSFPSSKIQWYKKHKVQSGYEKLLEGKSSITVFWHNLTSKTEVTVFECRIFYMNENNKPQIFRAFNIIPKSRPFNYLPLILISLGILFFLLLLYALYKYRIHILKKNIGHLSDEEIRRFINGNLEAINKDMSLSEQSHLLPYNTSFEISKSSIIFGIKPHSLSEELGSGEFGIVVKGIVDKKVLGEEESVVAVKSLHPHSDLIYFRALLLELKIMLYIGNHEYVLSLLGAVTENLKKREVFLILEYCELGNLLSYLQKNKALFNKNLLKNKRQGYDLEYSNDVFNQDASTTSDKIDNKIEDDVLEIRYTKGKELDINMGDFLINRLFKWCYEISNGMNFLSQKCVVHGDLAARNILLNKNFQVKVADFGFSRQLYNDENYIKTKKCPMPYKWMAVESIESMIFSTKSDVWSFGILVWEIFTLGCTPYPGIVANAEFFQMLKSGYRMSKPYHLPPEIYQNLLSCWSLSSEERPTFSDEMSFFEKYLE